VKQGRLYHLELNVNQPPTPCGKYSKNLSREGARYASLYAGQVSVTQMQDYVLAAAQASRQTYLTRSNIAITATYGWSDGQPVMTEITYNYPLLTTEVFGGQTVTLRVRTIMMIIRG
jgi:hypothetical protein